jgi:hypothetical protein
MVRFNCAFGVFLSAKNFGQTFDVICAFIGIPKKTKDGLQRNFSCKILQRELSNNVPKFSKKELFDAFPDYNLHFGNVSSAVIKFDI